MVHRPGRPRCSLARHLALQRKPICSWTHENRDENSLPVRVCGTGAVSGLNRERGHNKRACLYLSMDPGCRAATGSEVRACWQTARWTMYHPSTGASGAVLGPFGRAYSSRSWPGVEPPSPPRVQAPTGPASRRRRNGLRTFKSPQPEAGENRVDRDLAIGVPAEE